MSGAVVVTALAGLAFAHVGESEAAGHPSPIRTLVTTSTEIDAFAQDGRDIAWITRGGRCGHRLHIKRTSTGRTASINGIACTGNPEQATLMRDQLALANGRVLWNVGAGFSNTQESYAMRTASFADRRIRTLPCCGMEGGLSEGGAYLPLAGSGGMLVYYSHRDSYTDRIDERAVRRVVGARSRKLFDVERPLDLAVEGGRIAFVRRELARGDGCGCNHSPVWSPDGRRIVFVRTYRPWEHVQAVGAELAVMNADGTGMTALTSDRRERKDVDWANDGTKLVYTHTNARTLRSTIAVANADGTEDRDVALGSAPEWSPRGGAIAFEDEGGFVSVVNSDGTGLRRLRRGAEPTWSPDATRIAYVRGLSDLGVMRADGSGARTLVDDAYPDAPRWSPNGRQIAYVSSGIRVVNADGSRRRRLTRDGGDTSPDWSPDGRRIVFSSGRNDLEPMDDEDGYESELYVVNAADGSGLRPLSFTRRTEWRTLGQVRSQRGATVAAYESAGAPLAVAMSGSVVAVLTRFVTGRKQIALFDAASGASRGVVAVPSDTGGPAAASSRMVAFTVGRTIHAIDVRTRARRALARTKGTPFGFSIAGRRLAWAESRRGRGWIRALSLPG
jgi:Tol biopolymer transport system component